MKELFKKLKELMKDYQSICGTSKCDECPFNIVVGYKWGECEVRLCDAIDDILK